MMVPNSKISYLMSLSFCLVMTPLAGAIKHPTDFISFKQCAQNHVPITFLLQEANSHQFVLLLQDGVVVNEGGIVTNDGKILKDTETYNNDQQGLLKSTSDRLLKAPRDIANETSSFFDGRLAVISSPGQENWYHWLFQVLPRLKILADSGIEYDKIYINNLRYPWQHESLTIIMNKLNISPKRLLIVEGDSIIQAKNLIVPSVPFIPSTQDRRIFPMWLKHFLRESFLKPDGLNGKKRIYISRSKASSRRISNESELIEFLQARDFVTLHLEDLSVLEQARYFNGAEIIIGPHGSGFANLIFSRSNTHVIEIDHGLVGQEQRSFFKTMACLMDCTYCPFYCDIVAEDDLDKDMYINLKSFEKYLEQLQVC